MVKYIYHCTERHDMKYLFFDIEGACPKLSTIATFGYVLTDEDFSILAKEEKIFENTLYNDLTIKECHVIEAIEILKKHFDVENIKIAEPLYELQKAFYDKLGIDIGDKQDGELLQFLGKKVRKEHATFLLDEFDKKLAKAEATIISNDDCRPDDYQHLKEQGFIFVKINGFKRERDSSYRFS